MRLWVFVAFAVLSGSAFGQPLAGSRQAIESQLRALRTGARVFNDGHITKEGLPGYWDELAAQGLPVKMPYLVLSSNSAIGHVGILPDGRIGYDLTIHYKVIGHTDDGAQILVNFEYPETTATAGPFLFKNCSAKDVPTNGFFEPMGYWQITKLADQGHSKMLVVEPLPDGEVKLPVGEPKPRKPPEIEKHPYQLKYDARDWKNLDGSGFMRGIYIGFRKAEVWIMGEDNRVVKKRLFTLSKADQQFVQKEFKEGRRDYLIPEYLGESMVDAGDMENNANSRRNARRRNANP